MYSRAPLDVGAYIDLLKADNAAGTCFICELVSGDRDQRVIFRDDTCIAFFPLWPRLLGYMLLAPIKHVADVVDGATEAEYIEIQRRVYRLGRAISSVVPTERLYIFTFGSHQGVAHVHWHVAPLPPGLPFEEQQFEAVNRPDYLEIPPADEAALAERIAAAMAGAT